MAGHSRSKNGVASLAYAPAISLIKRSAYLSGMPGTRPAMTDGDDLGAGAEQRPLGAAG
jgi:hypothetical protein